MCSWLSLVSTPTIRGSILPALMSATPTSSSTTFLFFSSAAASAFAEPPVPGLAERGRDRRARTSPAAPGAGGRRRLRARRPAARPPAGPPRRPAAPRPARPASAASGPPFEAFGSMSPVGHLRRPVVLGRRASAASCLGAAAGLRAGLLRRPRSAGRALARLGGRELRRDRRFASPSPAAAASSGDAAASPARPARPAPPAPCRAPLRRCRPRRRDLRRVRAVRRRGDRRARHVRAAPERAPAGQRRQVHAAQHVADRARQVLEVGDDVLGELVDAHALHGGGHHHAGQAGARLADVERVHRLARADLHLLGEALEPGLAAGERGVAAEAVAERRIGEQALDQLARRCRSQSRPRFMIPRRGGARRAACPRPRRPARRTPPRACP